MKRESEQMELQPTTSKPNEVGLMLGGGARKRYGVFGRRRSLRPETE